MSVYPVNSAWLTTNSLHVQNYDGSERVEVCRWSQGEGYMSDPASLMDDADKQLELAGYTRNHDWAYCPVKSDGMWVSIRKLTGVYDVSIRVESDLGHGELSHAVSAALKQAGITYRSTSVRGVTEQELSK